MLGRRQTVPCLALACAGMVLVRVLAAVAPASWSYDEQRDKVVLVTGASRGLGAEFCIQFAKSGWTVLASTRDGSLPDSLVGIGGVTPVKIDLLSVTSITALAEDLDRQGRHIDLLINNAGIALDRNAPRPKRMHCFPIRTLDHTPMHRIPCLLFFIL